MTEQVQVTAYKGKRLQTCGVCEKPAVHVVKGLIDTNYACKDQVHIDIMSAFVSSAGDEVELDMATLQSVSNNVAEAPTSAHTTQEILALKREVNHWRRLALLPDDRFKVSGQYKPINWQQWRDSTIADYAPLLDGWRTRLEG